VPEAAGGGAAQSGGRGYLGEAQLGMVGVERADDRQPALQRLHEVAVGGLLLTRRFVLHAGPLAAVWAKFVA